jgi:hypothetical protein
VTFVAWPKDFDGPSFDARSEYVERCWTSVLGPTAVLALRAINHELQAGRPVAIDLDELGRSLGIGASNGKNSTSQRTLARLEQFRLAIALPDGSMAIRQELPPLKDHQLRRAGPVVRHRHEELTRAATPLRSLSR